MENKGLIKSVLKFSIAEEVGIEPGDCLSSINGKNIKDIFDYKFMTVSEFLTLEIKKSDNEIWEIEIEKEEYEDIGIEFENPLIDQEKACRNKCIFCFIDQLPKNMRKTLYFKDDDIRLSFLTGNYVTLTNVDVEELKRIASYRLSPVNVSVHTTNDELRAFMLNNKNAGGVLEKIKFLTESGIIINCQIVLCRDINDKQHLDCTIKDLVLLYPYVNSISIVPAGLTRYRDNLFKIKKYDKLSSVEVVKIVEYWQKELLKEVGSRIIYAADEFYIMAGIEFPKYSYYEDFPQIENGVGLFAKFRYDLCKRLSEIKNKKVKDITISIVTGALIFDKFKKLINEIENKIEGLKINLYKIENKFFGDDITVAGLLTGEDIIQQLEDEKLGKYLLIAKNMLRAGELVFLDDLTVEELENRLEVTIKIVDNDGTALVNTIIEL